MNPVVSFSILQSTVAAACTRMHLAQSSFTEVLLQCVCLCVAAVARCIVAVAVVGSFW